MELPSPEEFNSADWMRLRAEIDGVMDLDPEEGRRRLAERLSDQPVLLSTAIEMLALDEPPGHPDTPLALQWGAGLRVGPYVTRRELASGGMGAVYLAAREDGEFDRLVALKVIRPHLNTEEVLNRFRRERQVQANLDHPGIVRLLDGGATSDGSPYLVMEYVEGQRIDHYCDEQRLTNRERLALFRKVVDAVDHAHRALVVHRDLKPSNILVTAAGEPKLLDFGIAKVLDPEKNSREPEVTRGVMGFLTPAYASPEQLRGTEVTTSTDLYSLGVLLYQLLSGHLPHELDGLSPAGMERLVCEVEPLHLSESAGQVRELPHSEQGRGSQEGTKTSITPEFVSERRRTNPTSIKRELRGDLDAIVAMCLRKEARRRYATATALGDDIDRFLSGKPVHARPDSLIYRGRKYISRNRVGVGVGLAGVVALSAGLAYSIHQNRRLRVASATLASQRDVAEERLSRLRTMRRDVVSTADRIYQAVPAALHEVEGLLQTIERNLATELETARDDTDLLIEIAESYFGLAQVRFGNRSGNLGLREQAKASTESGLAALDRAYELRPGGLRILNVYSELLDHLAGIHRSYRDNEGAKVHCERLLALCDAMPAGEQLKESVVTARCIANENLSRTYADLGRADLAVERAQMALSGWVRYTEEYPQMAPILEGQESYYKLAVGAAQVRAGDFEAAHETLGQAEAGFLDVMKIHQGLGPMSNQSVFLRKRALAMAGIGSLEADEYFRRALESAEKVVQGTPGDNRGRILYYSCLAEYAGYLIDKGRLDEAEPLALAAEQQVIQLRNAHANLKEQNDGRRATVEVLLARLRLRQGRLVQAGELLASAVRSLEEMFQTVDRHWPAELVGLRARILRGELHLKEAESSVDTPAIPAVQAAKQAALNVAAELDSEALCDMDNFYYRELRSDAKALLEASSVALERTD